MVANTNRLLSDNVRVLKSRVSKTAWQGVFTAATSIVVATSLVSLYETGFVSVSGIIQAQSNNYALWVLDLIPLIFAFWGQYSSSIIAYEAGTLVFDQTNELRDKAEKLEKEANYAVTHDSLTELPNKALFYDRIERAIVAANSKNRLLSVLLVEIVSYKEIYDTLGRSSSDLILKQIATRLTGVVLDSESVARFDGNIFGILFDDITDEIEAELLAENIQKVMEAPFSTERLSLSIHSNIGVVHFPKHGEDGDSLLQRASVALYIARHSNKGYAVYEPSFDDHSPRRLTLMSELRRALKRDELELHYQAKICVSSGHLSGAEALIRWHHPKHGIVLPGEFIEMAERTRMIKPLTKWVLRKAFRECSKWHRQGYDLKISVNLSTKDLLDPELPDVIAGVAGSCSVRPEWIVLEITETSMMTDPEGAMETIERLHQMGYQFSIDDYGTGYSSLAYLKKIPLTELKIDRSFVQDILTSENDAMIVNATISLAHNLGLQVTAEGVESKEVMDKLESYGCDVIQGYYISKPISADEFTQWMQGQSLNPSNIDEQPEKLPD